MAPLFRSRHRRRRILVLLAMLFTFVLLYLGATRVFTSASVPSSDGAADGTMSASLHPQTEPPPPLPVPKSQSPGRKPQKISVAKSQADLPMEYGTNARPKFDGLVHMAQLPAHHLPTHHNRKRLVIVGDVHGMLAELEALLRKISFDGLDDDATAGTASDRGRGRDHLIFTGDMVNKGPDSPGVIGLAMRLGASAVRGNHEDRVLLARAGMRFGHVADAVDGTGSDGDDPGEDKLEQEVFSHGDYEDRNTARGLSRAQVRWLADRPVILDVGLLDGAAFTTADGSGPDSGSGPSSSVGTNSKADISGTRLVVVHAGLVPGVPLARQDPWAVMNMRSLVYPREILRREDAKRQVIQQMRQRAERHGGRGGPIAGSFAGSPPEKLVDKEFERRKKPGDRDVVVPVEGHEGHAWTALWDSYQARRSPTEERITAVFGHDARRGLHKGLYSFGLDTGCVRGGRLTAMVVEGAKEGGVKHRLVHVECRAVRGLKG